MKGAKTFFDSWYVNNRFLQNSGPLKIRLQKCYVVLWIHNIDAICIYCAKLRTDTQKILIINSVWLDYTLCLEAIFSPKTPICTNKLGRLRRSLQINYTPL